MTKFLLQAVGVTLGPPLFAGLVAIGFFQSPVAIVLAFVVLSRFAELFVAESRRDTLELRDSMVAFWKRWALPLPVERRQQIQQGLISKSSADFLFYVHAALREVDPAIASQIESEIRRRRDELEKR